jgi:hypothetical protein
MSRFILEGSNVNLAVAECNINGNSIYSSYFSMANYDRIMFVVTAGKSNAAGSLFTLEARQATSAAGGTNISMAANVTNVSITANQTIGTIEWRADQMNTNTGYIFAGVRVQETNTRESRVTATSERTSARFPQISNASLG